MTKPIRPDQVGSLSAEQIPGAVFEAFNIEIAAAFDNGSAIVNQERVVDRLLAGGMQRKEIFSNCWLNVEEAYRDAGWKVRYEKPGFNESGPALFHFSKR